jgi:hypothetical protein
VAQAAPVVAALAHPAEVLDPQAAAAVVEAAASNTTFLEVR